MTTQEAPTTRPKTTQQRSPHATGGRRRPTRGRTLAYSERPAIDAEEAVAATGVADDTVAAAPVAGVAEAAVADDTVASARGAEATVADDRVVADSAVAEAAVADEAEAAPVAEAAAAEAAVAAPAPSWLRSAGRFLAEAAQPIRAGGRAVNMLLSALIFGGLWATLTFVVVPGARHVTAQTPFGPHELTVAVSRVPWAVTIGCVLGATLLLIAGIRATRGAVARRS